MKLGSVMGVGDMAYYVYTDPDGDQIALPCTERLYTERQAVVVANYGVMPLLSLRGRPELRLGSFSSVLGGALAGFWAPATIVRQTNPGAAASRSASTRAELVEATASVEPKPEPEPDEPAAELEVAQDLPDLDACSPISARRQRNRRQRLNRRRMPPWTISTHCSRASTPNRQPPRRTRPRSISTRCWPRSNRERGWRSAGQVAAGSASLTTMSIRWLSWARPATSPVSLRRAPDPFDLHARLDQLVLDQLRAQAREVGNRLGASRIKKFNEVERRRSSSPSPRRRRRR